MKKEVIYTKENKIDMGTTKAYLHYYVYRLQDASENSGTYGIAIEKWIEEQIIEKEKTGGITHKSKKAIAFLEKLCHNQVTPMCLLEITDDCFWSLEEE